MSLNQQQEISAFAEQYDPNQQKLQLQHEQDIDSQSDTQSSLQNYGKQYEQGQINIKYSKQKGPNIQHQAAQEERAYNQSQHSKISQKICLNKLQACENKQLVKQKRNKDKAQRATVQQVLDPRTMTILNKLVRNGTFTQVNGCLSTGKEANVYHAQCESSEGKKEYAVKIYKTSILIFKDRDRYVQGQFRFRRGYCSSNPRKMVKMWAQKEFRNLKRIQETLPCPTAYQVKSNVLVMQFLGKEGIPAPKLKDVQKSQQQFSEIYLQLLTDMRILYQQCKLIHADLSEYNLLYHKDKIYTIDVSQSVQHDHPHALQFLRRDIINVNDFFNKKGVRVFTQKQVFDFIVSLDIPNGKQRQALEQIIQNYDDTAARDQVFNKIKIHRNLANIPIQKIEEQLFGNNKNSQQKYHHVLTGINSIHNKNKIDQEESDDSSSDSESSEQNQILQKNQKNHIQDVQNNNSQQKKGGKQKYQGLNKLQRKHKVKQEKRQKRKQKMPKKQKKKLMKK